MNLRETILFIVLVYLFLIFITLHVAKNIFMSFFLNFQLIKNLTFVYFNGKEKPNLLKDFFRIWSDRNALSNSDRFRIRQVNRIEFGLQTFISSRIVSRKSDLIHTSNETNIIIVQNQTKTQTFTAWAKITK